MLRNLGRLSEQEVEHAGWGPASSSEVTSATAVPGVSSAAFRITEQPAASVGAILRAGRKAGKFQGVSARTMPTGSGSVRGPMMLRLRLTRPKDSWRGQLPCRQPDCGRRRAVHVA